MTKLEEIARAITAPNARLYTTNQTAFDNYMKLNWKNYLEHARLAVEVFGGAERGNDSCWGAAG